MVVIWQSVVVWATSGALSQRTAVASAGSRSLLRSTFATRSFMSAADSPDPAASSTQLRAQCFCGKISVTVDSSVEPISSSICHCETCRRLTGAPMMATVLLPNAAVSLSGEGALHHLLEYPSHLPERTTRDACIRHRAPKAHPCSTCPRRKRCAVRDAHLQARAPAALPELCVTGARAAWN